MGRIDLFQYLSLKVVAAGIVFLLMSNAPSVLAFSFNFRNKAKIAPSAPVLSCCDLNAEILSPEGVELARQLELLPLLARLEHLRKEARHNLADKLPLELRVDMQDLKQEIMEKVVQTRLDIDFVQSGLSVDVAIQDELLHAYTAERDKRVNSSYLWSFRTNGALWAVAEALDIPTYRHPRYSIPSGTLGIIAGLVPSVFSMIAMREASGGHYEREARPNMLSKIFDYPIAPDMDYPKSVWNFLNAHPTKGTTTKSRREQLIERWSQDKFMRVFEDKDSKNQLDIMTGAVAKNLTIQLVSDRLAMLRQVAAVVAMMNRPLLEIVMVMRGEKSLPQSL